MLNEEQQKLVEDNIKLVYYMANRTKCNCEDSIQWGFVGLCLAAERFDPTRGVEFSTFACSYIKRWLKGIYSEIKFNNKIASGTVIITNDIPEIYNVEEYENSIILQEVYSLADTKMKKILDMLYEGHTQAQIAKAFDKSPATICSWLKKFKEEIKEIENECN